LLHGDVTTSRFTRKKCHEFIAVDAGVSAVKKVDDLLRVHPFTKLIRQGKIPSFQIGTDWRFLKHRLVRWMADLGAAQ
jgi:hypothetical protein